MKYNRLADCSFFLDKDHYVYDYIEVEGTLDIFIKSTSHGCECHKESHHLHATYNRTLQDVPIRCKSTYLHINVFKYECNNPECSTRFFMEPLSFARTAQVRTDALNTLILGVAMFKMKF